MKGICRACFLRKRGAGQPSQAHEVRWKEFIGGRTPSVIACVNATSLMEGGLGMAVKFPACVQSVRFRQRLPL